MRRFFNKYLPFTKGVALQALTYRFRFIFWLMMDFLSVVIMFFLWKGVYQSHANAQGIALNEVVIGSYTFGTMVMYIIFDKIVENLTSIRCDDYISDDIREGNIAMRLIKPLSYRKQLYFQSLGNLFISVVFFAIPFIIVLFICSFFMHLELQVTFYSGIMFAISIILGGTINFFISFLFGMILFLTINSFGMWQLRDAIERILSGSLIPLALFPKWLQVICNIMPFAQTRYVPICFILGQYNDNKMGGLLIILIQLAWTVGLVLLSHLAWRKATKRIIVQGG